LTSLDAQPSEPTRAKSKQGRNALILASVFVFPLLILAALFLFLRDSGFKTAAADPAIYKSQTSPAMVALLGTPMQPGWPIRGTLTTHQGFGNAVLRIPLAGPRAQGTLFESARRQRGKWQLCSLVFQSSDGIRLILVDDSNRCNSE
jgi:cytochrome oxidase complex assembly protein 1